jgi:LAS superfamily LD-carboxypeptidase LdcB
VPSTGVTWADVTNVGGIYVHTSIANNVRNLLNAATAAGFSLRGGGYRDPAGQIATRRANCGPTYYDIYEKPASQCTPPTARPGRSMHERGLAIDFTSSGRLITTRSDPAFVWLSNNAARFGLFNLPSEPWHWSTNGS